MIATVGTTPTRIGFVRPNDLVFNEGQTVAYVDTIIGNVISAPQSSAMPVQPASSIPWAGKEGMLYGTDPTGGNPGVGITPRAGLPFPAPINSGPNLVIPKLQSPNFVSGSTGWVIRKDGSVEFNNGVFRGSIVGGSLFVYNGTPGPGNSPVFCVVPPGTTQDPYGNPVGSVMEAGTIGTNFIQIDQFGDMDFLNAGSPVMRFNPTQGTILFYSPSAGLGKLVKSISFLGSGTDAFGNAYLPGDTNYVKITATDFQAYQTNSGGWNLWTAGGAGGPWNLSFSTGLQADEVGYSLASNVNGNSITVGETAAALQTFGNGKIQAFGGSSGGKILDISNVNSSTSALIFCTVNAQSDQYLAGLISGDTHARIRIDNGAGAPSIGGRILAGPGNVAPDTNIYRAVAGVWASNYIAFDNNGQGEIWTNVTFQNGWTNSANGAGMQYRRIVIDNCVQLVGRINAPAGIVGNQTVFTLPVGFRPTSSPLGVIGVNVQTGAIVRFTMTSGGVFQYQSGAAAGNDIDIPGGTMIDLTA